MATRGAQVTETDFTVQLVTIRSAKSFAEVTAEIERLFQPYDLDKLRNFAMETARSIKSLDEIELIRRSVAVTQPRNGAPRDLGAVVDALRDPSTDV